MSSIPKHGKISCTRCFPKNQDVNFGLSRIVSTDKKWRITNNPLSFGSSHPEIAVLGFSKGPTQIEAINESVYEDIPFKGGRLALGKILRHVGVLDGGSDDEIKKNLHKLISDQNGRFHFSSLIKCSTERYDSSRASWKATGGGMLDKFIATEFGRDIARNCYDQFLSSPPDTLKLVLLLGLGSELNYVQSCRKLIGAIRSVEPTSLNEVAYRSGAVTYVHTEHFKSQGNLLPRWLGDGNHERSKWGYMAREAVQQALG